MRPLIKMKKKNTCNFFWSNRSFGFSGYLRGFTTIELLISISIIVIISSIAVFNHQRFSESVAISNVAYDVAITLRQAQVYALSGRQPDIFLGNSVPSYGVRFSQNSDSFQLMADTNNDETLDWDIENLTLQRGVEVRGLCLANPNEECVQNESDLSVFFIRPKAQAFFNPTHSSHRNAKITLHSPGGLEKEIFVTESGQILVK